MEGQLVETEKIAGSAPDAWQELANLWNSVTTWQSVNALQIIRGAIGVVGVAVACGLLFLLLRWVVAPLVNRRHPASSREVEALAAPVSRLLLWIGLSHCAFVFPFPEFLKGIFAKIFYVLFALAGMSIFFRAWNCASRRLRQRWERKGGPIYGNYKLLLDLSRSLLTLIAWCAFIFFILQHVFQMDVKKLLVSAGIIGFGVAFAAKNTIANIFGAFAILGSRLFQVGDRIRVNDVEGVVEKIGVRSVRIRSVGGTLVDLPNQLIADSKMDNLSNRLYWQELFSFGLVYQTTPEQMEQALQIVAGICKEFADLLFPEKTPRFFFHNYGDSALMLEGCVWFKPLEKAEMLEARSRFNLEILRRFNAAGLDFAYPTTTVFLAKENAE